ncbi:MAG: cisplatin damage response ATP-dependent DNA ligase [Beijerinckiaceae bacterium]|nr:cisplatin damage response ATP-dependent DNA ligase [Beijerinckiaceae bacterium]
MNRFAGLLDRLAYEPSRNNKLRLITDYFRQTPDPERGYALAAMTGALSFTHAKPGVIRALIAERTDPVLFDMSYDYVGDLSETVALMWPTPQAAHHDRRNAEPPSLNEVVQILAGAGKTDIPRLLADWLDDLDETGRWALLKLITGSLRIGVSARLAKTALAALGDLPPNEIEEVWHGLEPPYIDLFAWVECREPKPDARNPAPFRTPMLSHAIEDADFGNLDPADFVAEWKWDGIRVQAVTGIDAKGVRVQRLYSRTGEDISASFPDLVDAFSSDTFGELAIDGELLILRDRLVEPFSILQQRLNRKTVSAKLAAQYPAHIRAYDLLSENGEDLRALTFTQRRTRLEALVARLGHERLDLSQSVDFTTWDELASARRDPAGAGAGGDAEAIEGVMLKRRDSIYVPGRPKGLWYKWKRDPFNVDAVLMYAQRGHGKRSSFYSDYTFGVWRGEELVPVGKAYFGFTDQELLELDRYVRNHTRNRFGPVRELDFSRDEGLVLEIAFEGLNRSSRHKSGVAMRFPRVSRIRWDKPAREADELAALEALLKATV